MAELDKITAAERKLSGLCLECGVDKLSKDKDHDSMCSVYKNTKNI